MLFERISIIVQIFDAVIKSMDKQDKPLKVLPNRFNGSAIQIECSIIPINAIFYLLFEFIYAVDFPSNHESHIL